MKKFIRTMVMCGAAAVALASTAARADGDEGREHRGAVEFRERAGAGREWRERRELDEQWRELAEARERFYAGWQGNPWRRARFERWYAIRRDELSRWSGHERREERDEHWRDNRDPRWREGRWRE
jgi:hypothetical protein